VDLHTDLFEDFDALFVNQRFFLLVQESHFCTRHFDTPIFELGFASLLDQSSIRRNR
jgi:hypothetical protein